MRNIKIQSHYNLPEFSLGWNDITFQNEDLEGEVLTKFNKWELESNLLELTENSAYTGHFSCVHKYQSPQVIDQKAADGYLLKSAQKSNRIALIALKNFLL